MDPVRSLIGRTTELATVLASFDGTSDALAVVLSGDAGIGKTAIWDSVVARRRAAGDTVLLCRASAAEARLPWVGLTDLLRTVDRDLIAALPEPQRRALEAVGLQTVAAEMVDERAVGMGLLSTLQTLSSGSAPVLIAVDDWPYFDTASASVVAFALRRIDGGQPTRLLATARGQDVQLPALEGLPGNRRVITPIGALSLGELFALLQARRGLHLARPLLIRVHDTSGGNPLYALELARALDGAQIDLKVGTPLPLPSGLKALMDARIRDLPPAAMQIVAATAAAWRLSSNADFDPAAVGVAVAAGMVVVDEPVRVGAPAIIRPAHPMWSAAAYNALTVARRQALHETLARASSDPVERVRHLALAATEPRADVADALDAGVLAALAAGVPDVAVELAQLAIEHSIDIGLRPARFDRLADAQLRAGDPSGAYRSQTLAMTSTTPGADRVRRRIRLAEIATEAIGWADAERELHIAVTEAAADPAVLAEALLTLAAVTGDIDVAKTSAEYALDLLDVQPDPDPVILSGVLDQVAGARFRAGQGLNHDLFARAIEIERAHPYRRLSDRADASYAALLKYADDLDGAEERLLALLEEARNIGDVSSIAYALGHLVHTCLWRGQLDRGRAYADEHVEVAVQGELAYQGAHARYNLALAMACQGDLEDSETVLGNVLADPTANAWIRHRVHATLGFVALSRNDPVGAARHTTRWHEALTAMHFGEPGYSRSHLDHLCALIGAGQQRDAETFCLELDGQARRSGRLSAAAVAVTGRAMLEAHAGQFTAAQASITSSLQWYDASPLRFDRARTLLIAGQISRRAKAKSRARHLLSEAEREFVTFGARAWAVRAAAELSRVNIRPNAPGGLTHTERLVAELAAAGLSNREVADRTFLATKTVEANLARVYRKLGIRSRAQLGARMGTDLGPGSGDEGPALRISPVPGDDTLD